MQYLTEILCGVTDQMEYSDSYSDNTSPEYRLIHIGMETIFQYSFSSFAGAQCGCPDIMANAEVQYSERDIGSMASYWCIDGYFSETEKVERTCKSDGSWSTETMTCIGGIIPSFTTTHITDEQRVVPSYCSN